MNEALTLPLWSYFRMASEPTKQSVIEYLDTQVKQSSRPFLMSPKRVSSPVKDKSIDTNKAPDTSKSEDSQQVRYKNFPCWHSFFVLPTLYLPGK